MNVQEIDFPEKFRPIIRRLQAAAQKQEVRDTMTIEDDFIAELNDYEHRIAEATYQKEEALLRQEEERSLKEEALRKQEEALRKQEEAVRLLLSLGVPAAEVAQKLRLDLDDVLGLV